MMDAALIFLRGLIQVAPVAASTYFVSHDRPLWAVAVGWWISFVWWWNAGSAAHLSGLAWATVYACGAATGTYIGQRIAQRLTMPKAGTILPRVGIRDSRIQNDVRDVRGVVMNTGE